MCEHVICSSDKPAETNSTKGGNFSAQYPKRIRKKWFPEKKENFSLNIRKWYENYFLQNWYFSSKCFYGHVECTFGILGLNFFQRKAWKLSAECQKLAKKLIILWKNFFPQKIPSDSWKESSFDNLAKKSSTKCQKVFAEGPKQIRES